MEIDARRLGILLAVSRAGGVVAAADTLRISPSAVSQQIAKLEEEIGMRVLDRQPTGAILTSAGKVLAESAERVEAELGDARRALSGLGGGVSGTVVVGAFESAIRAILVPFLATLEAEHPGVDLVIREVAEEHGRRALRRGEIDLLVIEHDVSSPEAVPTGVRDVPFFDEPWAVALPGSSPQPTSVMDLAEATWLAPEPGSAADRALRRLSGEISFRPRTAHLYLDFDVALAMVTGGLGVALLPSLALQRTLPENVQWATLPGLGSRQVFIRHRVNRNEPRAATSAVLDVMLRTGAALAAP
ncbi:MAG: LysR family transcriptional regulator [Actinomycetota bacterium]